MHYYLYISWSYIYIIINSSYAIDHLQCCQYHQSKITFIVSLITSINFHCQQFLVKYQFLLNLTQCPYLNHLTFFLTLLYQLHQFIHFIIIIINIKRIFLLFPHQRDHLTIQIIHYYCQNQLTQYFFLPAKDFP